MAECDLCGRSVDELYECAACGGSYCLEHRQQLLHGCRDTGGTGEDGDGADDPDEDKEASFATMVLFASAASVAVFLLIAAMLGVLQPQDVVSGGPVGGTETTTSLTEEPFDTAAFREQVLGAVNDRRAELGTGRLAVAERRQPVADRIAEDMAEVAYFENETAPESDRFAVEKRLRAANRSCQGQAIASYYLKTYYGQRINVGENVTVYETTEEVAESTARRTIRGIAKVNRRDGFERHALGVHVTDDGAVYVVYLAC